MEFLTMDKIEFGGKTVFVRVDINSPIDEKTGKIIASERIEAHALTIKELSEKGAKVVILAHQGRPGNYDFIPLQQHASLLTSYVGKEVEYVDEVIGTYARNKIKEMKPGDIVLLENIRFLAEEGLEKTMEEHAKSIMIRRLAEVGDIYVNDAFSAAHRPHASIVGFALLLPSVAGRVMEKELLSLLKVMVPEKPLVFVVGGAKPEDSLKVIKYWCNSRVVNNVLTCGIVGEVFLAAMGCELGKPTMELLEKKGYLRLTPQIKALLKEHSGRIDVPSDLAIDIGKREEIPLERLPVDFPIKDIGENTAKRYADIIKRAKTVVINGPAGVCEDERFALGTKAILKAAEETHGFSLVGGASTISMLEKGGIDKSKISYISLAGKAFLTGLAGESLPGVEALKISANKNFD